MAENTPPNAKRSGKKSTQPALEVVPKLPDGELPDGELPGPGEIAGELPEAPEASDLPPHPVAAVGDSPTADGCVWCGRKVHPFPGRCPDGIMMDPGMLGLPEWARTVITNLSRARVSDTTEIADLRGPRSIDEAEFQRLRADNARLAAENAALRQSTRPEIVDPFAEDVAPATKPCPCAGAFGGSCPMCHGSQVVPA